MKTLTFNELAIFEGGFSFGGFCKGFAGAQLIYAAGSLAGLVSPPGLAVASVALLIDGACYFGGGFR